MKITKNIQVEVPVTVDLTVKDIEVVYLEMQPDELYLYTKQLNVVAQFLRGTPVKIQHQLNTKQAQAIAGALADLANEFLKNCNQGLGVGNDVVEGAIPKLE